MLNRSIRNYFIMAALALALVAITSIFAAAQDGFFRRRALGRDALDRDYLQSLRREQRERRLLRAPLLREERALKLRQQQEARRLSQNLQRQEARRLSQNFEERRRLKRQEREEEMRYKREERQRLRQSLLVRPRRLWW